MIDIHCHILPGIDDGAANINEALEMASMAYSSGVKAIVATPHCNVTRGASNYLSRELHQVLLDTRRAIAEEGIPIKILSGMEVFATYDLPELISAGKILTINSSRYLLLEFDFGEDPEFADIIVDKLMEMNLIPVIAHPERYDFVRHNLEYARRLSDKGCILQANKGSFLGRYGEHIERTAYELLEENLVHVIASDAHSPLYRTPHMRQAKRVLRDYCDTKRLFEENPQKICMNKEITGFDSIL